MQSIRAVTEGNTERSECAAELTATIKIVSLQQIPLYQKLAQKATQLRLSGMTYEQIAKSLREDYVIGEASGRIVVRAQ